jgi:hypothetical protein
MADFVKIVLDNDYFYSFKDEPDTCIAKNDNGNIELRGNNQKIVDFVYGILSESAGKSTYSNTKYGLEYVLSKLVGPSIDYSSDFSFIEEDYEELAQKLKVTKSFKVIPTKRKMSDDE